MSELGEALKSVFAKVGQFLYLFDLSFLLSGAVSTAAVLHWCKEFGYSIRLPDNGWLNVFSYLLLFYIAGLISFALGRWPRTSLKYSSNKFDDTFKSILKAHGLDEVPSFKEYLNRTGDRGTWRLYVRLWAEVRKQQSTSSSLELLNRYWVMAATYDGLFVSICLWILVTASLTYWPEDEINIKLGTIIIVILILSAYACYREASRFVRYQVEELVAIIATERDQLLQTRS
jgi:hypothetical protein